MKIERPKSRQAMPPDAKRVFQGIIFDVYQYEVVGYDGTKKTFEKIKRPDTVMILPVTEDKKIILTKQEQPGKEPFIGSAGGRIDEGEEVLAAAKRELLEETGYEAKEWLLFDAVQPVSKIDWVVYTFIAKGCRKVSEQKLDGAEKIELKFVTFEEMTELILCDQFGDMELKVRFMEAKLERRKMEEIKKMMVN